MLSVGYPLPGLGEVRSELRIHPIHRLSKQISIAQPGQCALQRGLVVMHRKSWVLWFADFHVIPPSGLGGIIEQLH